MRLPAAALLIAAAPDKGAASLALSTLAASRRQEADDAAAMAEAEHAAMAARLSVEADWRAVHGSALDKHWHACALWDAAWQTAKARGDARHTMRPRPLRPDMIAPPDWHGTQGPACADASFPAPFRRADASGKRWIIGEGREWTGSHGGTVAASRIREAKGARDDRPLATAASVAYEWREGEKAGPYRAGAIDATRQERSLAEWQEEVERVRALHQ